MDERECDWELVEREDVGPLCFDCGGLLVFGVDMVGARISRMRSFGKEAVVTLISRL